MMLVVVIIAATSSLVIMALPSNSSPLQGREMLARLADAIPVQRMEAMAQGTLLGLLITPRGYQFMAQDTTRPGNWRNLTPRESPLSESITLALTQQDLLLDDSPSGMRDGKPQLLFFPGGEVTPFELSVMDQKKIVATLVVTEAGETHLLDTAAVTP
jgi:general secretion pathway protein H